MNNHINTITQMFNSFRHSNIRPYNLNMTPKTSKIGSIILRNSQSTDIVVFFNEQVHNSFTQESCCSSHQDSHCKASARICFNGFGSNENDFFRSSTLETAS